MRSKRRISLVFAVLGLILSACASGNGDTAETTAATPSDTAAETTVAEATDDGEEFVLVVPVQSAPQSLTPNWQDDPGIYFLAGNVYSTLVTLDWGVAAGTTAYGDVAESWEASEDATTYTFNIRPGITWHDGEELTASDVLYTFQTIKDNGFPGAQMFENAKLSSPDSSTFVVEFDEPDVSFVPLLAQLSNWYMKIMPEHVFQDRDWSEGPPGDTPIGSGPFMLESNSAEQMTLVANPDHYLGEPAVDRLIFRVVTDPSVANEAFNAGEYPYLPSQYVTSYEDIRQRLDDPGEARVIETPSTYGRDLIFNLEEGPTSDPLVRQAIAHAVNREQISELALRGLWTPAYWAGSPYVPEYLNPDAKFPEHDPAEAERLLDEAGFPRGDDGTRFTLRFTNPTQEDSRLIAEVVVEQLRAVGIDVEWETYDQTTWTDTVREGDFESSIYFTRYGPDPEALCEHFETGATRNFGGFSSDVVDAACAEARSTTDFNTRKAAYDRIQEVVVQEMPYVNLFGQVRFSLASDEVACLPVDECGFNKSLGWFGFRAVGPAGE